MCYVVLGVMSLLDSDFQFSEPVQFRVSLSYTSKLGYG